MLTAKQEAFKEAIVAGETPIDAARIAGYSGTANVLSQRAFELVRNSKIKEAIAKRKAELMAKTDWTIEKAQEALETAYDLAKTHKQPSAMVCAVVATNRMYGMDKDSGTKGSGVQIVIEAPPKPVISTETGSSAVNTQAITDQKQRKLSEITGDDKDGAE